MEQRAPPLNGSIGNAVAKGHHALQRRVAFFSQATQSRYMRQSQLNIPIATNKLISAGVVKITKCSI